MLLPLRHLRMHLLLKNHNNKLKVFLFWIALHLFPNDHLHDLICSFQNLMYTQVSNILLYLVVQKTINVNKNNNFYILSITTMQLQCLIANIEALVGGEFLGHCAMNMGSWTVLIQHQCRMSHHQSRSRQIRSHVSQFELY